MSCLMLFSYIPSFSSTTEAIIESAVDHLNTFNLPFMIINLLFILRIVFKYNLDTLVSHELLNPFSDKVILMSLTYSILNSLVLDLFQNRLSVLHKHVIFHIFHNFAFISLEYIILSGV